VRLPTHPVWFWLLSGAPFFIVLVFWAVARSGKISLKPLKPYLVAGSILFGPTYFFLDVAGGHGALRLASGAIFWTCWLTLQSINGWWRFETLRAPGAKWYIPWNSAKFSIPKGMRILVQNVSEVSPWYVEKLGLRKLADKPDNESGAATYKFQKDGNSIVLSTRRNFETGRTPILFSKKIGKMKNVLAARGIDVGTIKQDRQGIRYFQIHDPDENVIEVVEER